MSPIKITNHVVYSVPDSDSESEPEELFNSFFNTRNLFSRKQEQNLIRLGCSHNILDEFKQTNLLKTPKCYNQQFESELAKHQDQLRKETSLYLKQQRQKEQEELEKLLSEINIIDNKLEVDDKEFEEELKRQKKLIDEAIALDKKKYESQIQQAKLKEEQEKKEKEQKEKELKEKEQKQKELKEKNEQALKLKESSATSIEGLKEYQKFYSKIEHYQQNIRPKLKEEAFRKQCFMAKRTINRTVSQLQSDHRIVLEKFNVLHAHIMSIKQSSNDAFEVMLNHLAKVFLAQVKQEIHATNHAAYFLARFAYLMIAAIPEFLDYLMGRLMKRCQYLIPKYHDDDPTLSHDEIKSRLRYVYSNKEKKILETFLEHAESQKCYIMFYGALSQTLPDPGQPENPFPIKHAWIWLARICNMPPREVTPILVSGMLEVTGQRLLQAYPRQTPKLFRLIRETIINRYPITESKDNFASIKRLEMFLDDYFNTGNVNCLSETIPPSKN